MQTGERDYHLDLLRSIACIMVIALHAIQKGLNYSGAFCTATFMTSRPCIGLFFMISGSLLLPITAPYKEFLQKRLSKVLFPVIFFSIFYIILYQLTLFDIEQLWKFETAKKILSIPFSNQGSSVLWFMYPLVGVYLVAPIISHFFENATKREFRIILLLWIVSLLLKFLSNFLSVKTNQESIFYYFYGYLGYFLFGYYLKRFPVRLPLCVFPILIIIPFLICYFEHKYEYFDITVFLSITDVMQCIAWYQFVIQYIHPNNWSDAAKKILINFSKCSFGIYFLQTLMIFYILWRIPMSIDSIPEVRYVVNILLATLASWGVSYLISKTPVGKYLIGYQTKK